MKKPSMKAMSMGGKGKKAHPAMSGKVPGFGAKLGKRGGSVSMDGPHKAMKPK